MKLSKGAPFLMMIIWILGTLFWWGLAFYPTASTPPEWLTVARNVCFGAQNGGLPNAGGWIVLILGPISFLIVGFVAWPRELGTAFLKTWSVGAGRILTGLILAAVMIEAYWVKNKITMAAQIEAFDYANPSKESLPGHYPRTNTPVADFTLVDQSGQPFRLAD